MVLSLVNIDRCIDSNSEPEKCYPTKRTIGSLLSLSELNDITEAHQIKDFLYSLYPLLSGSGFFAAVSRFKFAVPIVADMCNKRYRRRQFDSADSEFGDLEKTEYKENPLLSGSGFQLVENPIDKAV